MNLIAFACFKKDFLAACYPDNHLHIWNLTSKLLVVDIKIRCSALTVLKEKDLLAINDFVCINIIDPPYIVKKINCGDSNNSDEITYLNEINYMNKFYLISGTKLGIMHMWNLDENDEYPSALIGHKSEIKSLDIVSTNLLASGSSDSAIILWNLKTGRMVKNFKTNSDYPIRTILSVRNNTFLSLTQDSRIILWDIEGSLSFKSLNTDSSSIRLIKILDAENILGVFDRRLKIYNIKTESESFVNLTDEIELSNNVLITDEYLINEQDGETIQIFPIEFIKLKEQIA